MRSTAYYAAWCAAAGDPERSLSASMAKAWCSDASRRVMATGLQVHGGIGFTWEHDMHLYLKRAQLDQVSYGDAAAHRDRIATLLRAAPRGRRGPLLIGPTGPGYEPRVPVRVPSISSRTSACVLGAGAAGCPLASLWGGTTTVRRTPTR